MELRHLKYFLTVAEELNFTKAAEKLFISQPPLSRQIKELENEIGAQLFERNNKSVVLTNAGKYFQKEAKGILKTLEKATLKTQKIAQNKSGEFRIGYISSIFSTVISDLINYLRGLYPYVTFKLYEVSTAGQVTALEQGKLDLGILRAPIASPQLNSQEWFDDTYSLVYNKDIIQVSTEDDIEKLKDEVFVFINKDQAPYYHNTLLEICSAFSISPNVVHESNSINSIVRLVKNGMGISIVPSSISKANSDKKLGFIEIKRVQLSTKVLLVTPKEENSEISEAAIKFLV